MEQRIRRNRYNNNNIYLLIFFFLVFTSRTTTSTNCHRRTVKHLSTTQHSSTQLQSRITPKVILISILTGIITGLLSALLFAFLVRFIIKFMNQTPILKGPVVFSPKITPKSLHLALTNGIQLLGSDPNGKYYKTVLDNGLVVAVKTLGSFERKNNSPERSSKSVKRRLQKELELLAGLRHRNLMSLRAYVRDSNEFSLVYDYMPSGSLEDVMNKVRAKELELKWEIRLRVAVGIVKGLQYLHFSCDQQILHYNLKPTNVMLDSEFEPRLADCGLAKTIPSSETSVTSCYSAPESSNRYTDKSDVFSFGMILGVLLTGRDPKQPFPGEASSGCSLGQWLKHLQQSGEAREALDKSILGEEVEEDEMLMALRITIICLSDFPADRPSSDELVHMLTQLHSF